MGQALSNMNIQTTVAVAIDNFLGYDKSNIQFKGYSASTFRMGEARF